jgi:hypothetical protein
MKNTAKIDTEIVTIFEKLEKLNVSQEDVLKNLTMFLLKNEEINGSKTINGIQFTFSDTIYMNRPKLTVKLPNVIPHIIGRSIFFGFYEPSFELCYPEIYELMEFIENHRNLDKDFFKSRRKLL